MTCPANLRHWLLALYLAVMLLAAAIASLSLASVVIYHYNVKCLISIISGFLLFIWVLLLSIRSVLYQISIIDAIIHSTLVLFHFGAAFFFTIQSVNSILGRNRFDLPIVVMYLVQLFLLGVTVATMAFFLLYSVLENKELTKMESPHTVELGSERTVVTNTQLELTSITYRQTDMLISQDTRAIDSNNWMDTTSYHASPIDSVKNSKSVPNFTFRPQPEVSYGSEISPQSLSYSTTKLHETPTEPASCPVKRSRSTGYINTSIKVKKREQRNKSISYEKSFLSNVNESLLPPVLRSGESPIMELKRKQLQEFSNAIPEEDDCSVNLPHISEFDEPVDQTAFEGFDQDTRIVPEKYEQSFTGLENIPELIDKGWLHTRRSVSTPLHLNHISFDDWKISVDDYHVHRSRSGANLNIPGITRLVSDHNLKQMVESTDTLIDEGHLLPPLNHTVDNIDDVSDIKTGSSLRVPSFTLLNRSFSAPSLHTYRKVSSSSVESLEQHMTPVSRFVTPEDVILLDKPPTPKNTSPIRRLLQESPKKLSNVFRRKSVATVDLNFSEPEQGWSHRHNKSVVSYQNSMNSLVSSRSTSPKRSLKSLLPSSSHKKNFLMNSFLSVSQSAVAIKQNITFVNKLAAIETPLDNWDLYTRKSSNNSRISSVPSAIIGEYDREKWRKLKELLALDQKT